MTQHHGRVTWFDKKNGYGFLACGHAIDVFADSDAIEQQSRYVLKKGDHVLFDIVDSDVGAKAYSVVKSKAPGRAATLDGWHFDLLAEKARPLATPVERELQIILLIEAAEDVAIQISDFLHAAGYFVVTCSNVQMAFDVYRSNMPIDLVMLGLHPPRKLAAYLEELTFVGPQLPVLVSAPVISLDLWREMRRRAWHFVPAAIPMPRLLSTVRKLLRPTCFDAA